ncbi:hypothetical protein HY637_02735 [Candidatus Woesearchaeota archaeon]|nr:hypothetical protein [Candidatus Woesearchaeota archaeon]
MSDINLENDKCIIVHSTSLPYFKDKKVYLFTLEFGEMIINEDKFIDLTAEGGIFHQYYTYKVKSKNARTTN